MEKELKVLSESTQWGRASLESLKMLPRLWCTDITKKQGGLLHNAQRPVNIYRRIHWCVDFCLIWQRIQLYCWTVNAKTQGLKVTHYKNVKWLYHLRKYFSTWSNILHPVKENKNTVSTVTDDKAPKIIHKLSSSKLVLNQAQRPHNDSSSRSISSELHGLLVCSFFPPSALVFNPSPGPTTASVCARMLQYPMLWM